MKPAGGYDSGLAEAVQAAMPGSMGGSGSGDALINDAVKTVTDVVLNYEFQGDVAGSVVPVSVVEDIVADIFSLFGLFGGGGPSIDPITAFELNHQGGSLVIWGGLLGFPDDYPPTQEPSAPRGQMAQGSTPMGGRVILVGSPGAQPPAGPTATRTPFNKQAFKNCLAKAAGSGLMIAPIVCVGTGVGCLQAEAPGFNVLSCRVAAAFCTTTAAIVGACAAGTPLPEF